MGLKCAEITCKFNYPELSFCLGYKIDIQAKKNWDPLKLQFPVDSVLSLTQLTPVSHTQDWGSIHYNQSVDGNSLKVAGQVFKEGIGMHAASKTVYELNQMYDSLSMFVGLDEESLCSDGFSFKILVDNQERFFDTLNYKNFVSVAISLKDAKTLVFESNPLSSKDCDHVDLLLPLLYKK